MRRSTVALAVCLFTGACACAQDFDWRDWERRLNEKRQTAALERISGQLDRIDVQTPSFSQVRAAVVGLTAQLTSDLSTLYGCLFQTVQVIARMQADQRAIADGQQVMGRDVAALVALHAVQDREDPHAIAGRLAKAEESLAAANSRADKLAKRLEATAADADRLLDRMRDWNKERGELLNRISLLENRLAKLEATPAQKPTSADGRR